MYTIIKKLYSGHETIAYKVMDDEHGIAALKVPKAQTIADQIEWLAKQQEAHDYQQKIKALANPAYNVPAPFWFKKFKSLEEELIGDPLTPTLFKSLPAEHQNKIITGLANFMNDMNQLKPVLPPEQYVMVTTDEAFDEMIEVLKGAISPKDVKMLLKMKKSVADIAKGSLVFSHRDFKWENVFYDKDGGLSIVDFAESGYRPIYEEFYAPDLFKDLGISDKILEVYRSLPRAQEISLDFDMAKLQIADKLDLLGIKFQGYLTNSKNSVAAIREIIADIKRIKYDEGQKAIGDYSEYAKLSPEYTAAYVHNLNLGH